jgi:hypothetical protein
VEAARLLQYGIGFRLDKKLLWALPESHAFSNSGVVSVLAQIFCLAEVHVVLKRTTGA